MDNVLHELNSREVKLYVVSSKKTDVLHRNLQTLNLMHYFKDWIGSDQVENYMPHPDGIRKLIKRYNLSEKDTLMAGDAIFDIQMTKAANVESCTVTWGSHSKKELEGEKPTYMVDTVQELLTINFFDERLGKE